MFRVFFSNFLWLLTFFGRVVIHFTMKTIKLFVIFAVTNLSVKCKLIFDETETLHINFNYVKKVFSLVKVPTTVLFINDEEVTLPPGLPSLRINNSNEKYCFRSYIKPDLYVVDLRTITIDRVILALRSKCVFNPRTFFYFIVNSTINFENDFIQHYISNFIITDIRGSMLTCLNFADNTRQQQFCANNTNNIYWYPSSTQTKLNLTVVLRITNPYVTGNGTGLEEQLLKYIYDWLKINVTFLYLPFGV